MKSKIISITLMLLMVIVPLMILKGRHDDYIEINQAYYTNREYYYLSDDDEKLFESFKNSDRDGFERLSGGKSPKTYFIAAVKYSFNNYENIDSDKLESYLKDCPLYSYSPNKSDFVKAIRVSRPFNIKAPSDDMNEMIYVDARGILENDNPNEKLIYVEYLCDAYSINNVPDDIKLPLNIGDGYEGMYLRKKNICEEVQVLADQIRKDLPADEQDSLKSISEAYVNWISSNLYYIRDYKNSIGIDNNLSNSKETLRLKAGVCEDFSYLLSDMLISQGIPARQVYGANPYKTGKIDNDIELNENHLNAELFDGKSWYMLNPTLYDDIDKNRLLFNIKGVDKSVLRGAPIDELMGLTFIPYSPKNPYDGSYLETGKFIIRDVDLITYTGK